MKSFYFDDSLYENELHYKLNQLVTDDMIEEDEETIRIKCDTCEEYNNVLDALFRDGENKFKMYGTSINPMEIIIEKDPRENYRKFDEENFLMNENTEATK